MINYFNESGIGYYYRKKALVTYFKKNNIKLVLAEYGPTGLYLMDVCKKANVILLPHFHGRDAYHYKTIKRFGEKYKKLFDFVNKVIVVSNDMKDQIIKLGAKPKNIVVNPCGPDDKYFSKVNIQNNPNTFISVGRLTPKKGPFYLIKAFHIVANKIDDARLIMIGDGPLLATLKPLARKLNLVNKIDFMGALPNNEVTKQLSKAKVFVQHSIRADDGDSEGTPVAVLEAMLSGLPVVSTKHAGIKDVVENNITGYLVEEKNYEDMSDKMIKAITNEDFVEMGNKGHQRVKDKYSLSKTY